MQRCDGYEKWYAVGEWDMEIFVVQISAYSIIRSIRHSTYSKYCVGGHEAQLLVTAWDVGSTLLSFS